MNVLEKLFGVFRMSSKRKGYNSWNKAQLIARIEELEAQTGVEPVEIEPAVPEKKIKQFDFSKYNTRFIALRFSYLGWNYCGLAIQKEGTPLPTIEQVLIDALYKCKMIPSKNPSDFKFSRCGRTDRGVSAMNQVVSLEVRSNLSKEEQENPEFDDKELDYFNIINSLLPVDILINGICLRPPKGFDARFSCKSRHYKYLFSGKGLDIDLMKIGANYYKGSHDFRNFCKLDGSKQIVNYERSIYEATIEKINDDYYYFNLKGSAFLWHQVRNMVAVLFLIGQKLEKPEVILELMDPVKNPRKPVYDMGDDLPLVLYDCEFENMEWKDKFSAKSDKYLMLFNSFKLQHGIKLQMMEMMNDKIGGYKPDDSNRINLGDGKGQHFRKYVPLAQRERLKPSDVVNEEWRKKKRVKY